MPLSVRDFDTMVNDTILRVAENTSITNMNSGSVIRTIIESILAENDVQYYQLSQIFEAMGLGSAVGSDLDRLVAILGVTRKVATQATDYLVFGRNDPFTDDIPIEYGNIISTLPDRNGNVLEFMVTQDDGNNVLKAGQLSVNITCTAINAGEIYVPTNALSIMNTPIVNIEYVKNDHDIYGGTDAETDTELRARAREALNLLGKGTLKAIEAAVENLSGVIDASLIDMPDGAGTVDVLVVTGSIPPDAELAQQIEDAVQATKSAGILATVIYPTISSVDVSITTTDYTDGPTIKQAIVDYFSSLRVAETFVVNQMERYVLSLIASKGFPNADVTTLLPTANVDPAGTEIIRSGTITINGVVV